MLDLVCRPAYRLLTRAAPILSRDSKQRSAGNLDGKPAFLRAFLLARTCIPRLCEFSEYSRATQ